MCKFDAKPNPNANNKGQQPDVWKSLLLLPFLNVLYVLKLLDPSMITKLYLSS